MGNDNYWNIENMKLLIYCTNQIKAQNTNCKTINLIEYVSWFLLRSYMNFLFSLFNYPSATL